MKKPEAKRQTGQPGEVAAAPPQQPDPNFSCLACRHYYLPGLLCRRFPPAVMPTQRQDASGNPLYDSAYPRVQPYGVCGEFTKKPIAGAKP